MKFPTFVYKSPGIYPSTKPGKTYDYIVVEDENAYKQKLSEGWFASSEDAINGKAADPIEDTPDDAPPTRAELEAMAKELGIKFDRRTGDKKLMALIDQELGE